MHTYKGKVIRLKIVRTTETLADKAYNALKDAIVKGELLENETLPEEKYAKLLGISRTPLRDAFNKLAQEGLIVQHIGKPAVVAGFSKTDSIETMELRGLLEVNNIEKIISKIDLQFIEELKKNATLQLKAIEENKYDDFIELDRDFHLILASKNQNKAYRELILKVNTSVNRAFLILSNTVPQSARDAHKEHIEIIDALAKKDVALAKNKMIVHMNNVEKRFLTYYANQED